MLLDWFTVGAQAINFLVLVWLLKRFLYAPVLRVIDERDRRIAEQLAEAGAKMTQAQHEREEFKRKNEEFERQRRAVMAKVEADASEERTKLLAAARQEAQALGAKLQDTFRDERRRMGQAVAQRTQQEVLSIARKTLTDLAGVDVEACIVNVFIARLNALPDADKVALTTALKTTKQPLRVRSASALSSSQQAAITTAIKNTLLLEANAQFETVPDLISGIELASDGHKVSWSVAEYLNALETSLNEFLDKQAVPERQP